MAAEHFCLRWNNHQSTLVSVFDNLLESGTLVDCTLAADGRYLKAHKVVLSACSPYLGMLLSQHYDKHPIIILKDVKFDELKAMLDYMYRGEVNISQEQLSTFLKAAETLQIKGLTDTGAEEGNSQLNRPPSSNSTTSAPTEEPLSPGSVGPGSPNPKKRKRNKHSEEPPDGDGQKQSANDGNVNVSSLSTLKNVSFGSVKKEPSERDMDGDGVMSVDDSNDSAMMARPGPSNGSGSSTNNKGSPWILSADSGGEEMQLTPGQDDGFQSNNELKEEEPPLEMNIKVEDVEEISNTTLSEEITISDGVKEQCNRKKSINISIYSNNRQEEMIVPVFVEDILSKEKCNEPQNSGMIRVIHSDRLMEITSKKSVPFCQPDSSDLFDRDKQFQDHSLNQRSNQKVGAIASKFRVIIPKVTETRRTETEHCGSKPPITTTSEQGVTANVGTQNISAGQFLSFATTPVPSSSSHDIQHNLVRTLPMQSHFSLPKVAHSAGSLLPQQWIVPQSQPTISLLNQPRLSFAVPQPVLVSSAILPPTSVPPNALTQTEANNVNNTNYEYVKTQHGYMKNVNKVPIPKINKPQSQIGKRRGRRKKKVIWQNRLLLPATTTEEIQRIPLNQEGAEEKDSL